MLFETSLAPLPVFGLRREMNRLFDDVMTRTSPTSAWAPAVDVREDRDQIAVSIELPGVKPEDVEATADNGMLTVRGQKSAERKEGDDETQYHLVERTYGSFTRSFRLPKGVDDSKIGANFAHGVLEIRVPKAALPQPRKIAIDVGHSNGNGQQVKGESQRSATQQSRSVAVEHNS
jgi:HSP20 family protein